MTYIYSPETHRKWAIEFVEGSSPDQIAHKYSVSATTVYNAIKKLLSKYDRLPSVARAIIKERGIKNYLDDSVKIDNIPKDITSFPAVATPEPPFQKGGFFSSTVLAIPDLHCPFQHPDALEFLKAVRNQYNANKFVCLGDEIDAHAFSRYPKDPDGLTAGKEMQRAKEELIPFYLEFPEMLVCESNHTVRPWKQAFEAGLPASFLPSYAMFLNAPDGWVWKSRHIVDNVLYIHGDAGKSGFTAHINYMKAFKRSVVIGHIHSFAGVNYEGHVFGMNTGCLIDVEAYCFRYARHMPIAVNLGCGIIRDGIEAFFVPMHLDASGRWTGQL